MIGHTATAGSFPGLLVVWFGFKEEAETRRHQDTETPRHQDTETQRHRDIFFEKSFLRMGQQTSMCFHSIRTIPEKTFDGESEGLVGLGSNVCLWRKETIVATQIETIHRHTPKIFHKCSQRHPSSRFSPSTNLPKE